MSLRPYSELRTQYCDTFTKLFSALVEMENNSDFDRHLDSIIPKVPDYDYSEQMYEKDFIGKIIRRIELLYDGWSFLGSLKTSEETEHLAEGMNIYQCIVMDLFCSLGEGGKPEAIDATMDSMGNALISFSWQNKQYSWFFELPDNYLSPTVYLQFFDLMNRESDITWRCFLDDAEEKSPSEIYYYAVPKHLGELVNKFIPDYEYKEDIYCPYSATESDVTTIDKLRRHFEVKGINIDARSLTVIEGDRFISKEDMNKKVFLALCGVLDESAGCKDIWAEMMTNKEMPEVYQESIVEILSKISKNFDKTTLVGTIDTGSDEAVYSFTLGTTSYQWALPSASGIWMTEEMYEVLLENISTLAQEEGGSFIFERSKSRYYYITGEAEIVAELNTLRE